MFKLEFIVLIYCVAVCYSVRQQITFYTERDCDGEGLILQTKQSDLVPEAPRIMSSFKSYLGVGIWCVYDGVNYTNGGYWGAENEYLTCKNHTFGAKSARYMGPPDTTTNSLSLYEDMDMGRREITVTGPAIDNIPFVPNSIITTGPTSWTFYTGDYFDGTATCFTPRSDRWYDYIYELNSTMSNTRSILRGCDSRIDHFIYGGDNKKRIFDL